MAKAKASGPLKTIEEALESASNGLDGLAGIGLTQRQIHRLEKAAEELATLASRASYDAGFERGVMRDAN